MMRLPLKVLRMGEDQGLSTFGGIQHRSVASHRLFVLFVCSFESLVFARNQYFQ